LCRASGDRRGLAIALGHLGAIALREGDTGQAEALFREHLELSRSLKDAREIARGLLNLGTVYEHRGDVERAVPHVAAANQLLKEIGLGAAGEADEVLARCAPRFGAGRLEALRNEYAGRTAAYLQRVDLSVRPLGPVVAAVPAATEAG
jgi:tetratricopeptide (TPR) repeat protein